MLHCSRTRAYLKRRGKKNPQTNPVFVVLLSPSLSFIKDFHSAEPSNKSYWLTVRGGGRKCFSGAFWELLVLN